MIEPVPVRRIATPCVNICRMTADGHCEGCGRTLDEIGRWTSESDAWRRKVMAELPGRHAKG